MSLTGKRILLTYGPTHVPLDRVRVISNISTGALGKLLVQYLIKKKARVTVLEGPVTYPLKSSAAKVHRFVYFSELAGLIRRELKKNYDVFIHAAAAADYRPQQRLKSKLSSTLAEYRLTLVPTPKLINGVKRQSPNIFLVGFKLEFSDNPKSLKSKALKLMQRARCDLVVANTVQDRKGYQALIFGPPDEVLARAKSRAKVARDLTNLIGSRL